MWMNNITDLFLESIISKTDTIPDNVIEQAELCLLDYYSCANLGYQMMHIEIEQYLSAVKSDKGASSVIGCKQQTSMHHAAFLNGIMSHKAELDDGHRFAMMHPGAPVISAVLAYAQSNQMSHEEVLKGIIFGYEAAIRVASAIQPGHKLKGYHATGTCGTIGAALGIACACGYTFSQMKTVLSAASSDAAGLLELMDNISVMKPYNCGRAAVAGINAALTGKMELEGPEDVLGGSRGFFAVTAGKVNKDFLLNGINGKYAIETIYRKTYAACRHCHPAIEAMLLLKKEYNLDPEIVEGITIRTYETAIRGHDHSIIAGSSSAKMSMPYSVAAALIFGSAGYQEYSDKCIAEVKENGIMNRITIEEDPRLSALVPYKRCAEITVFAQKKYLSKLVEYPKGEPENPVTVQELDEKFISLMKASNHTYDEIMRLRHAVVHDHDY